MAYARSPPIITFVGRPLASRKGLATFIDAIAVLGALNRLPPYLVWLVGGDTSEQRFLQSIPIGNSMLQELVSQGRWFAWGAVENAFLPEIYSRSTIVVIPSTFEQFGLVGVEAMACGCPVVASDVGGIRDTIIPGVTGELFPADDAEALANVLAGYLRNPQRRGYQSANAHLWARRFSTDKVYAEYYEAVCNFNDPVSTTLADLPMREWRRQVIESSIPECAKLLKQAVSNWEDCSGNSQVGAHLTTTNGEQYHAKFLRPRPSTHSLVLPVPLELQGPRTSAELVAKFEYFRGSGLTPTIKASSTATGIVLTEWLPTAAEGEELGTNGYSQLVQRFADWGSQNTEVAELVARCTGALQDFAFDQTEKTLSALDHAAAQMHAPMLGGRVRFHRIHPQVELFRIFNLLKGSVWNVSTPVRSRLESIIGLLLRDQPVIVEPPRLRHGSLKPTHVLKRNGQLVACDLDNANYAVGPLDAVHWYVGDLRMEQVDLRETLGLLSQLDFDSTEYFLSASWLFVYLVYGLLDALMRGKKTAYHKLTFSLMSAYEGMFQHRLIRWE